MARGGLPRSVDESHLVAVGVLLSGDRVLLTRRPARGPLGGLWEFPGGKVEFGEHPWDALRRELREEIALRVTRADLLGIYSHVYSFGADRVHVVIVAYRIRVARARVRPSAGRAWVPIRELGRWPIVPGSRPIVRDLRRDRVT